MKRRICVFVTLAMAAMVAGCSGQDTSNRSSSPLESSEVSNMGSVVSEDYFVWDGDIIIALSDEGAKQESLVIPARCEGFNGLIFADRENSVTSVSFESNNDIQLNGVFGSAENLTTISLPDELTTIGDLEFQFCSSLKEIEIPAGVTEIGAYAFQDNENLETVAFEGDTTAIQRHAFENCTSLKSITLPDSIELIDEYAFYKRAALQEITLPASLKTVGAFAFGNNGLKSITVPEAVVLDDYANTSFTQADHKVAVYVYESSWMDQNFASVFNGAFSKNNM